MFDPFKLFGRLILAFFKITGYFFAYGSQALWYVLHGRRDMVGDAIGELGRGITDALADIFEK
jgi:hypothetical protein